MKPRQKTTLDYPHLLYTPWQLALFYFGHGVSVTYGIACGFIVMGMLAALNFIAGPALLFVGALIFGVSGFINWKIAREKVSMILIDMFGLSVLFEGIANFDLTGEEPLLQDNATPYKDEQHKAQREKAPSFWARNKWTILTVAISLILALAAALTIAGQTYLGVMYSLGAFSPHLSFGAAATLMSMAPAVSIFFAAVAFIAFFAICLKAIVNLIKTENKWENFKSFFVDAYARHSEENENLTTSVYVTKVIITSILLFVMAPLAVAALILSMITSSAGLTSLFMQIPNASYAITKGICDFLSIGLATLGQLPFYGLTAFKTVSRIAKNMVGAKTQDEIAHDLEMQKTGPEPTFWVKVVDGFTTFFDYLLRIINAAANSLISALGVKGDVFWSTVGITGGAMNSFCGAESLRKTAPDLSELDDKAVDSTYEYLYGDGSEISQGQVDMTGLKPTGFDTVPLVGYDGEPSDSFSTIDLGTSDDITDLTPDANKPN